MEYRVINDDSLTSIADAIRDSYFTDSSLTFPDDFVSYIRNNTALNFGVIGGTTEPSVHLDNAIWVNTDVPISCWAFSPTEPRKKSGTKNLIVYPYQNTTRTDNGVTYTDNSDGTITVNGTATKNSYFRMITNDKIEGINSGIIPTELSAGTYTISGNSTADKIEINVGYSYDGGTTTKWSLIRANSSATFTLTATAVICVRIKVLSGDTVSNAVVKPQLEKGSVATTFVKGDPTGQVWFRTGTTSDTVIDAFRTNSMILYPLEAKQDINGAWVSKTANIIKNSEWTPITPTVTYLIKNGDEIVDFVQSDIFNWTDNGSYIHMYGYTEGYWESYTQNVDLTNVSQIVMTGTFTGLNSDHILGVWSPSKTPTCNNADASVQYKSTGAVLDVTSFRGVYHVGLTTAYTSAQQITNIYLV